ncbi:MAG: GtrA family protein [Gammaproteobacteria bacterium]|nr:GtrA family protein [Gammaproteobacteria bacterium]
MAALPRRPAARFALVGVVNFAVSCLVFAVALRALPALLPAAGAPVGALANAFAYLAGMVNSFVLNRRWTFRAQGAAAPQAVRFAIVNLGCLAAGSLLMYGLVDRGGLPAFGVWPPLTLCLIAANYLGCKHWAFAPARR